MQLDLEDPIFGQIRHLITVAGTALVAEGVSRGWVSEQWVKTLVEIIVGIGMIATTMAFSWVSSKLIKRKIQVATDAALLEPDELEKLVSTAVYRRNA